MSHAQVKRAYKAGEKMTLCFVSRDLDMTTVKTGTLEPKIKNQLEQILNKYKHLFPEKLEPDRPVRPGMPEVIPLIRGQGHRIGRCSDIVGQKWMRSKHR